MTYLGFSALYIQINPIQALQKDSQDLSTCSSCGTAANSEHEKQLKTEVS